MSNVVGRRASAALARVRPARALRAVGTALLAASIAWGNGGAAIPVRAQGVCGTGGPADCRLPIGTTVEGTLPTAAERHQYELEAPGPGTYTIDLTKLTADLDVQVLGPDGAEIGTGHQGGSVNERVVLRTEAPGRYRVLVTANQARPLASPASYALAATSLPAIGPENATQVKSLATWGPGLMRGPFSVSQDGLLIAAPGQMGPVVWDLQSPDHPRFFPGEDECAGVAISPDGQVVAVARRDLAIHLHRVADGAPIRTLPGDGKTIPSNLAFSPDGQTLAVTGFGMKLQLWRVADGTLLHTLDGSGESYTSTMFSADGQTVLANVRGGVTQWQVSDGTVVRTWPSSQRVTGIGISPDGSLLAMREGESPNLTLWNVADGQKVAEIVTPQRLGIATSQTLAFSPDSQLVANGWNTGDVMVWRVADQTLAQTLTGVTNEPVVGMAFSPDGQTLAMGSQAMQLHLWRLSDGTPSTPLGVSSRYRSAFDLSPDGHSVAIGRAGEIVERWRTSDGAYLEQVGSGPKTPSSISPWPPVRFTPDGQLVASRAGTLQVWDLAQPSAEPVRAGGTGSVMAISPDGQALAARVGEYQKSEVQLWRPADLSQIGTITPLCNVPAGVAFSPSGQEVAIAHGATLSVWRVSDQEPVWGHPAGTVSEPCTAFGQSPPKVYGPAYSPDGTLIATGSTAIVGGSDNPVAAIWRASDGELMRNLTAPTKSSPVSYANIVAFSPDGRLLATASNSGVVGLWRVEDGALLHSLKFDSEPHYLAFGRDGQRLFSGSWGAAVQVWAVQ